MDPDPSLSLSRFAQESAELALDPFLVIGTAVGFLFLLLVSAIASGSEAALFSIGVAQREELNAATDRASRRVRVLLERPRPILVSVVVLNTVANVMAAIVAAFATARIAIHYAWRPAPTVVAEVLIVAFVLLFVCEVMPKLIAMRNPLRFSRAVSGPLLGAHRVLSPLSASIASAIQRFQHRFADEAAPISADELKTMAEIGEEHGTIQGDERELIHSIIEFGETAVREIMVSRLDIRAIPVTCTLGDALAVIRESGHSRLPLYVDHLDNILGVVHAKDLLPNLSDTDPDRRLDWIRIARRPMFVPLGKRLDDLLRAFQEQKIHIAIVVDEYGGTAGVVTLEDVLEEIVGDIRDEHDESDEELYHRIDEGVFLCDSRLDLDDLNELLDADLETDDFDFETLGGLIYHLSGEVPREGDRFTYKNLELQVKSIDGRRIGDVVVRKQKHHSTRGHGEG